MSSPITAPPIQYAITALDPHGVHAPRAAVVRTRRGRGRDRPADSRPRDSASGDRRLGVRRRAPRRAGNNRAVASAERYTRSLTSTADGVASNDPMPEIQRSRIWYLPEERRFWMERADPLT